MKDRLREITLHKSGETYIFRFDAASHPALLGLLARFAASAELAFSWHDAAVVCRKVRDQSGFNPCAPPTIYAGGRFA